RVLAPLTGAYLGGLHGLQESLSEFQRQDPALALLDRGDRARLRRRDRDRLDHDPVRRGWRDDGTRRRWRNGHGGLADLWGALSRDALRQPRARHQTAPRSRSAGGLRPPVARAAAEPLARH